MVGTAVYWLEHDTDGSIRKDALADRPAVSYSTEPDTAYRIRYVLRSMRSHSSGLRSNTPTPTHVDRSPPEPISVRSVPIFFMQQAVSDRI